MKISTNLISVLICSALLVWTLLSPSENPQQRMLFRYLFIASFVMALLRYLREDRGVTSVATTERATSDLIQIGVLALTWILALLLAGMGGSPWFILVALAATGYGVYQRFRRR